MYGLVIESMVVYIRKIYGDDKWMEIRRLAKIEQHSFSTHLIYSETTIPRLIEAASVLLGVSKEFLLMQFGNFFVTFVSQYGYDKILRVLGRNMRDFLNGLDNLHEYMRFSYPKLKPPSFFVEKETEHGLILHYRSKRRYGGYVQYVKGQIKNVGLIFYGLDIDIELLREEFLGSTVHVTMQLRFDNSAFLTDGSATQDIIDNMKIESEMFFEAFPFHIVFTEDMTIRSIGHGLSNVIPNIEGFDIGHIFTLKRPMVEFSWDQVMTHTNNVFEMESVDSIQKKQDDSQTYNNAIDEDQSDITDSTGYEGTKLHLKGQMIWVPEWQGMLFLGTPVLSHLTAMFESGLFINDLSLHDNSRDLVLAGTQTSAELKLALDQEQVKSRKLEDSMRKLDEEMRRTDELLYQMIPRTIADRLRAGEPAVETCQVFNDVTILFSDVVGFTVICSRISPLQVVNMLNLMYSKFDQLCSSHDVYKVETIGDAYVVVAGAPEEVADHAEKIAEMGLGMVDTMPTLVDPSTNAHLKIRVGVNSGVVVAGVVGLKMPRYCLFGDAVNTAAKMEATSESMRIQITETTLKHLQENPRYDIVHRGIVDIKDKGKMSTYWLNKNPSYQQQPKATKLDLEPFIDSTAKTVVAVTSTETSPAPFKKAEIPWNSQNVSQEDSTLNSVARLVPDNSGTKTSGDSNFQDNHRRETAAHDSSRSEEITDDPKSNEPSKNNTKASQNSYKIKYKFPSRPIFSESELDIALANDSNSLGSQSSCSDHENKVKPSQSDMHHRILRKDASRGIHGYQEDARKPNVNFLPKDDVVRPPPKTGESSAVKPLLPESVAAAPRSNIFLPSPEGQTSLEKPDNTASMKMNGKFPESSLEAKGNSTAHFTTDAPGSYSLPVRQMDKPNTLPLESVSQGAAPEKNTENMPARESQSVPTENETKGPGSPPNTVIINFEKSSVISESSRESPLDHANSTLYDRIPVTNGKLDRVPLVLPEGGRTPVPNNTVLPTDTSVLHSPSTVTMGYKEPDNLSVPALSDGVSTNSFDAVVDELLANEFSRVKGKKVTTAVSRSRKSDVGNTVTNGLEEKDSSKRDTFGSCACNIL